MNLLERLNLKLEIFRLEQRYTRQRSRRTTFVSGAQYVNGDYIYSADSPHLLRFERGLTKSPTLSPDKVDQQLNKLGVEFKKKPICKRQRNMERESMWSRR